MDVYPIKQSEIEKLRNDELIVQKTALQIIKDFSQFGYDISFPENLHMAYQDLYNQLLPFIQEMFRHDLTRFYALLYRIDLNENTIRKELQNSDLSVEEIITHLLLERELKKVITRDYFSRQG